MKTVPDHAGDLSDIAPRPLSRLSYQIMGLNLMALLLLVAGIFYLDQYKKDLTSAETEILATEAKLYASIISDNAVRDGVLDTDEVVQLLQTFSAEKIQRLRVFSPEGKILADTNTSDRLATMDAKKLFPGLLGDIAEFIFSKLSNIFAIDFELPRYPVTDDADIKSFPDAGNAFTSELSMSAWQSSEGGLILSAAVPVIKNEKAIASILVTRADTKIQHTFSVMRIGIFQFFLGCLLITLCFSLYLSAAIGHPLRKLAGAAEAVREGRGGINSIPDMSGRKDEIGELSLALREMAQALQERIDSIERFAADVSHELKNPLTSMRSAVETLEKIKREEDREKLMAIIIHDLVRMDRLISDISRASRLDVELLRDVLEPVDLRNVLLPLIDAYKKPLERHDQVTDMTDMASHNIECKGLGESVMVMGQAIRLSQVFQNLIANALSFSPPGKTVRISVKKASDTVTVIIEDSGPGIPENRLEKIFERFYTERPNAESFGSHSGLGLSIVRQILASHDGSIKARNNVDDNGRISGAQFVVKLRPANDK